ncbi:protein kinase activating protein dpb11, variant 2 [Entomophthora muscae]|uniref:Protein kinase activating protein dpb11, variant 2 n=1 Tax=Entomophthora muscae TaxID=34485 RepID=A0ACC2TSV3_9FUNG|nr:protein kinase activating protein dpb11, variant 2 [Entomophthora muscae]
MSHRHLKSNKPFKGLTFSLTGVKFDFRSELSNEIQQLGGIVKETLDKSTTHLIAKSKTSAKFKAAVTLKIPILFPAFVKECYENFISNSPFSLEKIVTKHSMFPLLGKCVTISGFEEDRIKQLEETVLKLGGTCQENFSSLCDYYICDTPSKDETMQVGAKGGIIYKSAWLESLWFSLHNASRSQLSATECATQNNTNILETCFFTLSCDFKCKARTPLKEKLLSLGAKVANQFNRLDATHYFIAASAPSKNEKEEINGFKQGISVVDNDWLEHVIETCNANYPPILKTSKQDSIFQVCLTKMHKPRPDMVTSASSSTTTLLDGNACYLSILSKPIYPKSSILKGVVLFLSPNPEYDMTGLTRKAHAIGATTLESFDLKRTTHLISSHVKGFSTSKTFRSAVQNSIIVINHSWIDKCFETGCRLDEIDFLYTKAPEAIKKAKADSPINIPPKQTIESTKKEPISHCPIQSNPEAKKDGHDPISDRINAIIKEAYIRKVLVCNGHYLFTLRINKKKLTGWVPQITQYMMTLLKSP